MKLPTARWNFVFIPASSAAARCISMTATLSATRHGEFLRQTFTCQSDGNSVRVNFGARQGTYAPWWKTVEVVIYDWPSAQARCEALQQRVSAPRRRMTQPSTRCTSRFRTLPAEAELRVGD